jgi:hypothetical protein
MSTCEAPAALRSLTRGLTAPPTAAETCSRSCCSPAPRLTDTSFLEPPS